MAAEASGIGTMIQKHFAINEILHCKILADCARDSYSETRNKIDRQQWHLQLSELNTKVLAYQQAGYDLESLAIALYHTEQERLKFIKIFQRDELSDSSARSCIRENR